MKSIFFLFLSTLVISGCATPSQIAADAEVKRLCAIDGGIKVHEVVLLPAEKFDSQGNFIILSKQDATMSDEYYYEREITYLGTGNPRIWRSHHRIVRARDKKTLGESIRYARRGGDVPGPWHDSSFSCPDTNTKPSIEKSVFKFEGDK